MIPYEVEPIGAPPAGYGAIEFSDVFELHGIGVRTLDLWHAHSRQAPEQLLNQLQTKTWAADQAMWYVQDAAENYERNFDEEEAES